MNLVARILAAFFLFGASSVALAHPGHNISGFMAGITHPFAGSDHLLAMLAVGLWAAQGGGRRIWLLPAAFMTSLALGALLSSLTQSLPLIEAGIAASVLALGLLIALSLQLPPSASAAITGLFGLMHGYAHGLELPASASPAEYALGFLLATASLHLSGIALGIFASRYYALLIRLLGSAITVCGAYLLFSV